MSSMASTPPWARSQALETAADLLANLATVAVQHNRRLHSRMAARLYDLLTLERQLAASVQ